MFLFATFLLNEELSILFACSVEYIENGISASILVPFIVYLAEKQVVKEKKSSEVST